MQEPAARVLFVCLGNICRSPTAEGVFRHKLAAAGLAGRVAVDSAGTGTWHLGEPPDRRAQAAARARGIDIADQRARRLEAGDFESFDYILAMDRANLAAIAEMFPEQAAAGKAGLFLEFAPAAGTAEVPDPFYGAEDGFKTVFDLVDLASDGLIAHLRARLG